MPDAATLPEGLLLTYYGDDFTGSTDVAEVLTFNGLPTVLLLDESEVDKLDRFRGQRAVGIAGISRSQSPQWMSAHLPPLFERLKAMGGALCHYKVCSTFDSSPETGNIGRAIEIGRDVFGARWTPLIVGAPALDRYVVFGNLFAGVAGLTYRIDRHPVMSRHPVTPMDESDLRNVLARQTGVGVRLVDWLGLGGHESTTLIPLDGEIVLFDTLDEKTLVRAGELVWESRSEFPFFAAGSSGLEYALVAYWREQGLLPPDRSLAEVAEVDRIVVASGSCSSITERQIRWALQRGYVGIRLDAGRIVENAPERDRLKDAALAALGEGRSVVLYSALGPDDPLVEAGDPRLAERLASETGVILREVLLRSGVRRTVVAGGDTSSHAGRQLGLYALTPLRPASPGAPLCRGWADSPLDGLEISFKGGQRGNEDFFDYVRRGAPAQERR